ncbi:MAG: hypothetical protein M3477_00945, partial [Gemmatimonadota bacterium]|nr:hypothetical protein [Gemmatimonadota bacterium]
MPNEYSRREFAESLALAALVPLLGGKVEPIRLGWGETPAGSAADHPGALARALADVIRVQYGSRLREADLATITNQIQNSLERSEQIRKIELANGDEPFTFSALPPSR